MFDKNPRLQKGIDQLYNELREQEYGTRFSWRKLHEMSGLGGNVNQNTIYYVANRVCLLLMRHDQKFLATDRNYGKRIINPEEHTLLAKKTAQKSVRIYKKAGSVLASTNMDVLTEDQKKEVITAANKYSTLEMFTTEMLKKKKIGQVKKEDVKTAGLFLDAIKMFSEKS